MLTNLRLAVAADGADCDIARSAIEQASKIRGLKILHSVPCKLQNEAQVERYLRDTIESKISREKIELEGTVFRLLGVIPPEFKYFDGMISLYTSQLGGYYDPEQNYYAMASWMPMAMQVPIAVHELTHALQDQHFELDKMIDHKTGVSDALVARSALVEGDATAVMIDYSRITVGQAPIAMDENVSGIMMQNISGAMLSPALHQAPPALQAMLLFPYISGLRFVHVLLRDGGYRNVDRVFKKPPVSTEQILHPEKYLKGTDDFEEVRAPVPPGLTEQEAKPVFTDRGGEFFISTFLGTYLPADRGTKAAAGWGGDEVALFTPSGKPPIVSWITRWDTAADADEFFKALFDAYKVRFTQAGIENGENFSFESPITGPVTAAKSGRDVTILIGSKP